MNSPPRPSSSSTRGARPANSQNPVLLPSSLKRQHPVFSSVCTCEERARTAGHSHSIYTGEYTDKARGGGAECSSLGGRELLNLSTAGRETSRTRASLKRASAAQRSPHTHSLFLLSRVSSWSLRLICPFLHTNLFLMVSLPLSVLPPIHLPRARTRTLTR